MLPMRGESKLCYESVQTSFLNKCQHASNTIVPYSLNKIVNWMEHSGSQSPAAGEDALGDLISGSVSVHLRRGFCAFKEGIAGTGYV